MSIHDFYSKLVSQNEKNALFGALRRLSLLPDLQCLNAEGEPSALGGWTPWEGCEDGTCPCAVGVA